MYVTTATAREKAILIFSSAKCPRIEHGLLWLFLFLLFVGIALHQSDITWDSVGGLKEVKDTLKETLEWPAKYPDLFKKAPIR